MKLSEALLKNLHDVHEDAAPWLADLPALLAGLEHRWNVRVTGLVPDLSYNVVAFAESADGAACILKLSPPSADIAREIAALRLYDGDGTCRLLEADSGAAALLLERVLPGASLWSTDCADPRADEAATRSAAQLMRQLWRPVPADNPFRTLASWTRAIPAYLAAETGPLPRALVRRAEGLRRELLETESKVLLHADLHHGNILRAERQAYLAIDPKGIVGPRGYEVGPFLENPTPRLSSQPALRNILARRVEVFAETLELPANEVAAWSFVHAVLSACWSAEDHGEGWEAALAVAGALAAHV